MRFYVEVFTLWNHKVGTASLIRAIATDIGKAVRLFGQGSSEIRVILQFFRFSLCGSLEELGLLDEFSEEF